MSLLSDGAMKPVLTLNGTVLLDENPLSCGDNRRTIDLGALSVDDVQQIKANYKYRQIAEAVEKASDISGDSPNRILKRLQVPHNLICMLRRIRNSDQSLYMRVRADEMSIGEAYKRIINWRRGQLSNKPEKKKLTASKFSIDAYERIRRAAEQALSAADMFSEYMNELEDIDFDRIELPLKHASLARRRITSAINKTKEKRSVHKE